MDVWCLALVIGEPCVESGARAKCLGGCLVALVAVAGSSGRVGVCTKRKWLLLLNKCFLFCLMTA